MKIEHSIIDLNAFFDKHLLEDYDYISSHKFKIESAHWDYQRNAIVISIKSDPVFELILSGSEFAKIFDDVFGNLEIKEFGQ